MITSEVIEHAISEQFQFLRVQLGLDYGLRRYDSEGGGQSGRPWRTTGFYVRENARSRLVLEVFSSQASALAVVRVYREVKLKILYAKKLTGGPEPLPRILKEATDCFRAALPSKPPRTKDLNLTTFPPELAEQLERLMLPTPPPMDLARIEEA